MTFGNVNRVNNVHWSPLTDEKLEADVSSFRLSSEGKQEFWIV